jgi:hypothetical protein
VTNSSGLTGKRAGRGDESQFMRQMVFGESGIGVSGFRANLCARALRRTAVPVSNRYHSDRRVPRNAGEVSWWRGRKAERGC